MNVKTCIICNNPAPERLRKGTIPYYQCTWCKTLFSDPLPNDNLVGGGAEVERNTQQNPERILRLDSLFHTRNIDVLDMGCGHGYLVKDLNDAGFRAVGYDCYNPEFSKLPEKGKFDACFMVEVAEHLSVGFVEFDVVHRSLKPGGVLIIETSSVTIAEERGIALEDFFYISPEVGHSTIYSRHGLDLLMALKNFKPFQHFNENVTVYVKR